MIEQTDVVARIENLEKAYVTQKSAPPVRALRGVDLVMPRGQYSAIMGPSGSGKSTLMNIIGCLDRPTSGRYLIDGDDVSQMGDRQLSHVRGKRLGFVFQSFNLIAQLKVVHNVETPLFYQGMHPKERRKRSEAAIERVGLAQRLDHRPAELSGGQMQRVAIARALVNEPAILLADEPTGNLDSETGESILQLFDELHRAGLTIITVTHDEHVAQRCQRIIRLFDGLIREDRLLNQPQTTLQEVHA